MIEYCRKLQIFKENSITFHFPQIYLISDQVYLMRYEDICRNGQRETNKLQNFLDLKTTPSIEEFIVNEFVPSKAFKWKNNIFQNDISEVQTHCFESMKYLGYNPIVTSIKGLINRQDDLLGYPLFDML